MPRSVPACLGSRAVPGSYEVLQRPGVGSKLPTVDDREILPGALSSRGRRANLYRERPMVKAIAEHAGTKMPSFFGFLGWSVLLLGPLLTAVGISAGLRS